MATESEHLQKAQHIQDFLDSINVNSFPDWYATAAFYKAVHLVEALCRRRGHATGSHLRRNTLLKRRYPAIWRDYRPLWAFSRTARYWCVDITPAEVPYVLRRLRKVERAIQKLLS